MATRISPHGHAEEIEATDPGSSLVLIAPSDDTPLENIPRSLWVTAAGDLCFICENDTAAVTISVSLGLFPFRVKQVKETGTTATVYGIY